MGSMEGFFLKMVEFVICLCIEGWPIRGDKLMRQGREGPIPGTMLLGR